MTYPHPFPTYLTSRPRRAAALGTLWFAAEASMAVHFAPSGWAVVLGLSALAQAVAVACFVMEEPRR